MEETVSKSNVFRSSFLRCNAGVPFDVFVFFDPVQFTRYIIPVMLQKHWNIKPHDAIGERANESHHRRWKRCVGNIVGLVNICLCIGVSKPFRPGMADSVRSVM